MKVLSQFDMYETHSLVIHVQKGLLGTYSEYSRVYTHSSQNFVRILMVTSVSGLE
jgi:hypothetical protein